MTLLAEYSFNEGAGTTVGDTSGNGHTLTLPASARAKWVTGKNGGGLSGGTAAYVVNDPTANGAYGNVLPWYPLTTSWSVAFWAKIPSADGRLLWDVSQAAGSSQQFGMMAVNNVIWFLYPGSQFISSANWADNAWHHWAWTYNSATKTSALYVDGAPCATTGYPSLSGTSMAATWTAAQLSIVGVPYSGSTSSGSSNGTVDDFRIFDTALTQADVQTWMNTPAGGSTGSTYAVAGTAAAVSGATGSPTVVAGAQTYAAAGTTHAVTGVVGAVTAVLLAAGAAAGVTGSSGNVDRVPVTYAAAGSAAVVTGSTGAVTVVQGAQTLPAAGTAAGITGTSGALTLTAAANGASAATSTAVGAITATLGASGTTAAVTGSSGTPSIVGGPQTYPAAGAATTTSTAHGAVTLTATTRGTCAATSTAAGSVTLTGLLSGTVAVVTTGAGQVTLTAQISGTATAASDTHGAVTVTNTANDRDIDVTASPISTAWQVMGTTAYPLTTGNVNNDNGYSAAPVTVDPWAAAPLINQWTAGAVWIQE